MEKVELPFPEPQMREMMAFSMGFEAGQIAAFRKTPTWKKAYTLWLKIGRGWPMSWTRGEAPNGADEYAQMLQAEWRAIAGPATSEQSDRDRRER